MSKSKSKFSRHTMHICELVTENTAQPKHSTRPRAHHSSPSPSHLQAILITLSLCLPTGQYGSPLPRALNSTQPNGLLMAKPSNLQAQTEEDTQKRTNSPKFKSTSKQHGHSGLPFLSPSAVKIIGLDQACQYLRSFKQAPMDRPIDSPD